MKTKITLISLVFMAFSLTGMAQKNDVKKANETIQDFLKKDSGLNKFFSSAHGYAVFPSIGKGGLGVGGAGGKGTVYQAGADVADVKMSQITIGFQAGGQKYAEVIFFENEKTYNDFISGTYEFAAQVSAIALASGVSADAKYKDGIMVITQAIGGLMYEASVGGQKFKIEKY